MNNRVACCDLAMIGAGVSAAYTVSHYVQLLRERPPARPVRIAILEKSAEFWAGAPYGRRSGPYSLVITALKEFLPDPERRAFTTWLRSHAAERLEPGAVAGRPLSSQWRRANAAAIAAGRWDDLFIPRALFGRYLQETTQALLDDAVKAGLIEYRMVAAEVTDLQRQQEGFSVRTASNASGQSLELIARQVVLALGSPSNRPSDRGLREVSEREVCVVENPYDPGLEENLSRLARFLKTAAKQGRDQVLILGANASALEVLYSLVDSAELAGRIGKFLVVSRAPGFPHRIGTGEAPPGYRAVHLDALMGVRPFQAVHILDALERDVADAERACLNVADIFHAMSRAVLDALNALEPSEQAKFVSEYGERIGRLQRRAGADYMQVVERLLAQGRLDFVRGEFIRFLPAAGGGPGLEYLEPQTRQPRKLTAPLAAVINCSGFTKVTDWPSPLVQNLIRRGLCRPNESNRGFLLNEHFECSPHCYVMGPLVAGNLNRAMRVWHAESCSRIISLSQQLAQSLLRDEPETSMGCASNAEPLSSLAGQEAHR